MTMRYYIRRTLVAVDQRVGMREWLRQSGHQETDKQAARLGFLDPFGSPDLGHSRPCTVLDIGGSHGQFAKEAIRAFPGVQIYSFEPIPECYEELLTLREHIPTLHPIRLALSDCEGEKDFWLSGFRDSSSLQEMLPAHMEAWPHTQIESKISVELARLDDIAPMLVLEPPIFAKIDVQGHELAVIRGGIATLSLCQRVVLECNFAPLYKGQPSFTCLYDEMRSLGFLLDCFICPLRHPRTRELLSSDVVFYKPVESSVPNCEKGERC